MRTPLALVTLALVVLGCAAEPQRQVAAEPAPAPAPRPGPRPRPAPATPAVVDTADPWARCAPGAEFVQRRTMVTKPPLVPVTTEARYVITVVAIDSGSVTVRTRSESTSAPPDERQETLPRGPVARAAGAVEREETTVTVPAGTFPCVRVKSEGEERGMPYTVEQWYDPTLPLPYRITVHAPRETQTIELESFKLE